MSFLNANFSFLYTCFQIVSDGMDEINVENTHALLTQE